MLELRPATCDLQLATLAAPCWGRLDQRHANARERNLAAAWTVVPLGMGQRGLRLAGPAMDRWLASVQAPRLSALWWCERWGRDGLRL